MKRIKYEIRIWQWTVLLHKANYEFNTEEEADNYALGLFDGFRLAGKEVTGYKAEKLLTI